MYSLSGCLAGFYKYLVAIPLKIWLMPILKPACMSIAAQHGQIGCVCIDYIQLVKLGRSTGNKTMDLDLIAERLDLLRKELNCVMIWLIQPTNDVETRTDKRPQFADARGTAVYRQMVDGGFYLFRVERYLPNSPDRGMIEIGCEKYRDGEAGCSSLKPLSKGNFKLFKNP